MKGLVQFLNESSSKYEAVDLDLPSSTKWCNMNVGAKSESDAGLYFQWGDTDGYTSGSGKEMSIDDYKYGKYDKSNDVAVFSKYNPTDGLVTLERKDDAASENMGGKWKIPTKDQFEELLNEAYFKWVTVDDVVGLRVFSKKDENKYIFLPVTGFFGPKGLQKVNKYDTKARGSEFAEYWSSSVRDVEDKYQGDYSDAHVLVFGGNKDDKRWKELDTRFEGRTLGLPIRAVLA